MRVKLAQNVCPLHHLLGRQGFQQRNYERASDPWVTISPNGVAHQIALVFDFISDANQAILVSRSTRTKVMRGVSRFRSSPTSDPTSSTTRRASPPIRWTVSSSTPCGTGSSSPTHPDCHCPWAYPVRSRRTAVGPGSESRVIYDPGLGRPNHRQSNRRACRTRSGQPCSCAYSTTTRTRRQIDDIAVVVIRSHNRVEHGRGQRRQHLQSMGNRSIRPAKGCDRRHRAQHSRRPRERNAVRRVVGLPVQRPQSATESPFSKPLMVALAGHLRPRSTKRRRGKLHRGHRCRG